MKTMTTEQLLVPRYEVVADYPDSTKPIGTIIELNNADAVWLKRQCSFYDKYFNLFKKLQWWEKRELKDMPEYVRVDGEPDDDLFGQVVKVTKWDMSDSSDAICDIDNEYYKSIGRESTIFPATQADYENYLKSKST